ncbi:MAG TPA: phosphatidylserine decarboxylase [Verrucomicrobiae bacterium]|jgi:phosphatidylserine decarboxylase
MKHTGKAGQAGRKLIFWTLVVLFIAIGGGVAAVFIGSVITFLATTLIGLWVLFALFTLYFFRDPNPRVPMEPNVIVAPAHGKVDLIDETDEPGFIGGRCRRVSIFLSVFNVHVQQAPVAGRVAFLKHTSGQYLNALKAESAVHNENVLLGFESKERPGEKIGVRLIAGLIARRIVPWVSEGDEVARGERISLIQFGSRVDLYLPLTTTVTVKTGDKVVGGQTVVATRN